LRLKHIQMWNLERGVAGSTALSLSSSLLVELVILDQLNERVPETRKNCGCQQNMLLY
jgi:hypothetical protein